MLKMLNFLKKNYNKPKKLTNNFIFLKKHTIFSKSTSFLSIKELEASRRVITGSLERLCKVEIFINNKVDITRKSLNMRMGKGRGKFLKSVHPIFWGSKIISVGAPNNLLLSIAIKKASKKISCNKKIYF